METKVVQLRAHQKNIDRYEGLLQTKLSEVERQCIEKRLSEERLAMTMLQFMSPSLPAKAKGPFRSQTKEPYTEGRRERLKLGAFERDETLVDPPPSIVPPPNSTTHQLARNCSPGDTHGPKVPDIRPGWLCLGAPPFGNRAFVRFHKDCLRGK